MKIGLTYDLRADYLPRATPWPRPPSWTAGHVDGLEAAIRAMGTRWSASAGWRPWRGPGAGRAGTLVFNIAEGMHGFGREAAVPALLEAWGIPCTFSDPW
jgi:D-alanine-D-alanine ligase